MPPKRRGKRAVARRETAKAESYLRAQGVPQEYLEELARPALRALASALEVELHHMSSLSPDQRRKAEMDLVDTVKMAIAPRPSDPRTAEWPYGLPSKAVANFLVGVGCKTEAGKAALRGMYVVLSGEEIGE